MAKPLIDAHHLKASVLQTRTRLEAPEGGMIPAMAGEAFQRCPLWNLVGRGVPVHRRVRHRGRLILDTVP